MKRTWGSTQWGAFFTRTAPWSLTLEDDRLIFECQDDRLSSSIASEKTLSVEHGKLWATVRYTPDCSQTLLLDGIPNAEADDLTARLRVAGRMFEATNRRRAKLALFDTLLDLILNWKTSISSSTQDHRVQHRWITEETLQHWIRTKPAVDTPECAFTQLIGEPEIATYFANKPADQKKAVDLWRCDLRRLSQALNQQHMESEIADCDFFFKTVEKSPLTAEQVRSIICFDNRVLLIAAAGSGKTSTMIAKAGYALHRGLVTADQILLLAFNSDAAKELQERIDARLAPLGFDTTRIVANTFHAFGLSVVGKATGKKPALAPWIQKGKDIAHLAKLIDDLKDRDVTFRAKWDLFHMVFSRDLPDLEKEGESPEDRDSNTKKNGFRTLKGEVVASHSERLIADWLFYNGVNYQYERPYEVDTSDSDHGPYNPDFYYPEIDLYHEHFAFDEQGKAPAEFKGYADSATWKRALHSLHQTDLIETTSADIRSGRAFNILAEELTKRGVILDPNPDRDVPGKEVIKNRELVKVFRTFLVHAKSNRLTETDLFDRLRKFRVGAFTFRHEMFLNLFSVVRRLWDTELQSTAFIDFEDMLNLAADHLERGNWEPPYKLVMVDEFQDASYARARLTRSLVSKPGSHLFAVGDDWQSVNRFAGADISVMTDFEKWFGRNETLRLERTFRCPQSLCDVSSTFVQKNSTQIAKNVRSEQAEHPPAFRIIQVPHDRMIIDAITTFLCNLNESILKGKVATARNGKVKVFVIGRYRTDEKYVPQQAASGAWTNLSISFNTVHGSKGLEADYVVLPRVVRGVYSFPSSMLDDPVLQLAMPSGESYPFSEERRLFYVALTRARRSVVVVTVENRLSPFVGEIVLDNKMQILNADGTEAARVPCPLCKSGTIVEKPGKFGLFQGCSCYPQCKYTVKPKAKPAPLKKPAKISKRWAGKW